MDKKYEMICERIRKILAQKGFCIVSIDGRCGSGKSTFGKKLQKEFDGNLLHMDDFFLRMEQRTPERYAAPGENVDHERFEQEVLIPLSERKPFVFYPFDCTCMHVSGKGVEVPVKAVNIIEGSYSMRTDLRKYYDLTVFLTVDPQEQIKRIIARNPDKEDAFREKWIPLEEAYFSAFDVENAADIVIVNQ